MNRTAAAEELDHLLQEEYRSRLDGRCHHCEATANAISPDIWDHADEVVIATGLPHAGWCPLKEVYERIALLERLYGFELQEHGEVVTRGDQIEMAIGFERVPDTP